MTNTPQGMSEEELRKGLSKIRDKIIESANDGYSESINDEDYYDKPLFDLITQYSLTKQLEARVDELEKLGNTTNYDEVPYFTGIAWEVMQERIRALKTPHEWRANDTLSVFKCRKCGITGFAPHPLPEYGCNAELKHQLGKDK